MTRVHPLKYLGGTVPVWYDPENPARVVVDYEADVHQVSEQDRRDLRLVFAATPAEALRAALAGHPASGSAHAS